MKNEKNAYYLDELPLEEKKSKTFLMFLENLGRGVSFIFTPIIELFTNVPFNGVSEFFAWFAGADILLFRQMPSSVQAKRTGFGFMMFVAVLISAFFAGRMWGDIFNSFTAGIIICFLWFMIIWALDRAIVVYMDHDNGKTRWVVIARLLMVLGVSYINTTFINMEIFKTEIFQQLILNRENAINSLKDSTFHAKNAIQAERELLSNGVAKATSNYRNWSNSQETKIEQQRTILANRKTQLMGEVAGRVGSRIKGYGEASKADERVVAADQLLLDQMVAKYEAEKIICPEYLAVNEAKVKLEKEDPLLYAKIKALDPVYQQKLSELKDEKNDGYSNRYLAMWQVARKIPFLFFMIFVFFFVFESLVVLMKVMAAKDNYDNALSLQKNTHLTKENQDNAILLQTQLNKFRKNNNGLIKIEIEQQFETYKTETPKLQELFEEKNKLATAYNKFLSNIEKNSKNLDEEQIIQLKKDLTRKLVESLS